MDTTIKDKLERVGTLIAGWEAQAAHDELERDLALQLLREVYAEIKFGMPATTAAPAAHSVDETLLEGEDCQIAEEDVALEGEDCRTVEEPAHEQEPEIVPEQEPEPEPEPEPPIIPRRVAPEVIRSLYGTDTDDSEDTLVVPEAETVPSVGNTQKKEHRQKPEPAQTLADAMAPKKTLGETLRKGERDMASKIAAAERPGLKRSIGLNDRFLMIRDMFGGDGDAFDRAIARLDAFTDLDEAVIWIHDNFDWSADSKGATLLVNLLERKLGR